MSPISNTERTMKYLDQGCNPHGPEILKLLIPYHTRCALASKWRRKKGISPEEHEKIWLAYEASQASKGAPPTQPEVQDVTPQQTQPEMALPPQTQVKADVTQPPPSPQVNFVPVEKGKEAVDEEADEEKKRQQLIDILERSLIKETRGEQKLTEGTNFVIYQAMQATENAWKWPKYNDRNKWLQVFIRTMMEKHYVFLPAYVDMREVSKSQKGDGDHPV